MVNLWSGIPKARTHSTELSMPSPDSQGSNFVVLPRKMHTHQASSERSQDVSVSMRQVALHCQQAARRNSCSSIVGCADVLTRSLCCDAGMEQECSTAG